MNKLPSFSSFARHFVRNFGAEKPIDVPCGECNSCCKGMDISLDPNFDDCSLYKGLVPTGPLDLECDWKLPMDDNRLCGYFVDGKCSIYSKRPHCCKTFDCRLMIFIYREVGHTVWQHTDVSWKNLIEETDAHWDVGKQDKRERSNINTFIHLLLDKVFKQKIRYESAMFKSLVDFIEIERIENKTRKDHKSRLPAEVRWGVENTAEGPKVYSII